MADSSRSAHSCLARILWLCMLTVARGAAGAGQQAAASCSLQMSPRSFYLVDVTSGVETYEFTQLTVVCEYPDGSPANLLRLECAQGSWDDTYGDCGLYAGGYCLPSDPGCVIFHNASGYSPYSAGSTGSTTSKYADPSLNCAWPHNSFNAMPKNSISLKRVMLMPYVETDAVYTFFRYQTYWGFELYEEITDSITHQANRLNVVIFHTVEMQGHKFKVGPTLEEMQASCDIRLNTFIDMPVPTPINNNMPVSVSEIPTGTLPCVASDILDVQADLELLLQHVASVAETHVECNSSMGFRRLAEEEKPRETSEEPSSPLEQSSLERVMEQRRLQNGSVDNSSSLYPWELQDGAACWYVRDVIHNTLKNGLIRAFMFTAKDSFGGCKNLLDSWTTKSPVTIYTLTDKCDKPAWSNDGYWDWSWLNDPCCNDAKRAEMCCAPRYLSTTLSVVSGVVTEAISQYAAATNTGDLALRLAMQYAQLEGEAAQTCFTPFRDFWSSVENAMQEFQRTGVENCFSQVTGSYNSDFRQELGPQCTSNDDCWTQECKKPRASFASTSSGSTKYCVTPINTASQDFVTPITRCLMATSPPIVAEYFSYTVRQMTGNVTVEAAVASLGLEEYTCYGNGHADNATNEAECLSERFCNWNRDATTEDTCLRPCETAGGAACPGFCGHSGFLYEVGYLPICKDRTTEHGTLPSECRAEVQAAQNRCYACQTSYYWSCWASCTSPCYSVSAADSSECFDNCYLSCGCPECASSEVGRIRDECRGNYCSQLTDDSGNVAVLNSDTKECVFPSLSYHASLESACTSECNSTDGPMPAPATRCYARLKRAEATEETCSKLGDGWIEPVTTAEADRDWDWSFGAPPPEYCLVHDFLALNGKPYVPPPRYGATCSQTCEQELDSCLFVDDHCWKEIPYSYNYGTTYLQICNESWTHYKTAFENCEAMPCQGNACLTRRQKCLESSGFQHDYNWKSYNCGACSAAEWSDYEFRAYQCMRNIGKDCQWSGEMNESATCATGCIDSLCKHEFQECLHEGETAAACSMKVKALNQCRTCELVRCDAYCSMPCELGFAHWTTAEEYCNGCPMVDMDNMTSNDTDVQYTMTDGTGMVNFKPMCFPGSQCYGDRRCWGIDPPYGANCSLSCEGQLDACKARAENERCYAITASGGFVIDECFEAYAATYETQVKSCVLNNAQQDSASCARSVLPADWPCWECDSNNTWNDNVWEMTIGPECLAGNRSRVDDECGAICKPATCPSKCPLRISNMSNCMTAVFNIYSYYYGYYRNYHLELCSYSPSEAKALTLVDYPECEECEVEEAASCDEYQCNWQCNYMMSWQDAFEKCSGCNETMTCNPTSPCFISKLSPNLTAYDEWLGVYHPNNLPWFNQYNLMVSCGWAWRRRLSEPSAPDMLEQEGHQRNTTIRVEAQHLSTPTTARALQQQDQRRVAAAHMEAKRNAERKIAKRVEELGLLTRISSQKKQQGPYENILKQHRALQAEIPRQLQGELPEFVQLSCKDGNCSAAQTLCDNFFNRDGDDQARVDDAVESYGFTLAPWESADKICQELHSPICFVETDELYVHVASNYSAPWYSYCGSQDPTTCTCSGCDGVPGSAGGQCDDWCCQCATGEAGLLAFMELDGMYSLASWYATQAGLHDLQYDDRLFQGSGGFRYYPNPGQPCVEPFRDFNFTRKWEEGHLDTPEKCEATSCFPDSWIQNEDQCEETSYCTGDCSYCEAGSFDNPDSRPEPGCQFTTITGNALSESDCRIACGGAFSYTCSYAKSPSGMRICKTDPPSDATGDSMKQKCKSQRKTLTGASVAEVKYSLLSCSQVPRADCSWAGTQFHSLQCSVQKLPCKTKSDCDQAGTCDYMLDSAEVRKNGGLCLSPLPWPTFSKYSGPAFHQDCPSYWYDDVSAVNAPYGCVMKYYPPSLTYFDKWRCDTYGGSATWRSYAYSKSECEIPGYAFDYKSNATYACCIQWFGTGEDLECEAYSKDSTQESCEACGNRWVSIFKWRRSGHWVEGRWQKSYSWLERKFEPINSWIPVVSKSKLNSLLNNVIESLKVPHVKNLINCRLNPALDSMAGLAKRMAPIPKLGEANILPGQAASINFGKVVIETNAGSNTGNSQTSIAIGLDSSQNNLNSGGSARRMTDEDMNSSSSLANQASCYAVVTEGANTVGQIIGDCISFEPSQPLTGPVQLCTAVDSSIPTNAQFTVKGFTLKDSGAFSVLTGAVTESASMLCTNVQNNGTYCPMLRYADYTSAAVVSADNSCPALQTVAETIVQRTEVLLQNTSALSGNGGIVLLGETTTTTTRPPASFIVYPPTTTMTHTTTTNTTTSTTTTITTTTITTTTNTSTTLTKTTMTTTETATVTTATIAATTSAAMGDTTTLPQVGGGVTTETTTMTVVTNVLVTGEFSCTVGDPEAFAASEKVRTEVIPKGIASALDGVEESMVEVTDVRVGPTRRLSAELLGPRRLSGAVIVDYRINYGSVDPSTINTNTIKNAGTSIKEGINSAVSTANLGSGFEVASVTVAEPVLREVIVSLATTITTSTVVATPTSGTSGASYAQAVLGVIFAILLAAQH